MYRWVHMSSSCQSIVAIRRTSYWEVSGEKKDNQDSIILTLEKERGVIITKKKKS